MPGTRDTRAHTGTRIAQTPQPSKPTNTPARPRATTESAAGSTVKLNSFVQQPQPRSRTLPKRSPRPTQKRPPPANPRPRTRPGRLPLPERLRPPRTCSLLPCSKHEGGRRNRTVSTPRQYPFCCSQHEQRDRNATVAKLNRGRNAKTPNHHVCLKFRPTNYSSLLVLLRSSV